MTKNKILKIITVLLTSAILLYLIIDTKTQNKPLEPLKQIPQYHPQNQITITTPKPPQKRKEKIKSIVSNKTIYLTFDDGPSYLTSEILNILEKENVSATFFVIGKHIEEYKETVKRAYSDGFTIALHSNTHNYKYIYSNDENYFNDLKEINDKVYKITNTHSRIVRLPGGSSNTVSKKYNEGITTRITKKLTENDYYYFDWNVDSGDASGKLTKEQIYNNVTLNLKNGTNIILMHDTAVKESTKDALEDIIKYGKQNGYTFARITKETTPIKHHVNN